MKLIQNILFLLLTIFQFLECYSQTQERERDSIAVTKIAMEFFTWYISVDKGSNSTEYYPVEIEDTNGMTTLDFSKYIQNLRTYSFSDSLIVKEKLSYQECIKNLAKIKYSDYLKFQDLADFESIDCDFSNYNRWTGGQEMGDGYLVVKTEFDKQDALVTGLLYYNDSTWNSNFKKEIYTTLIKQNDKWQIYEIKY